jgi:hypothetical protein
MKNILYFILFTSIFSIQLLKPAQAASPKLIKTEEELFEFYKPSKETCITGAVNRQFRINATSGFNFACLVAGYKNVLWLMGNAWEMGSVKIGDIDPALIKKIIEKNKFTVIPNKFTRVPGSSIIYTPKGKRNALLFLKYLKYRKSTKGNNHIII